MLPFTLAPKSPQLPEAKEVVATLALTEQMIVQGVQKKCSHV